MSHHEHPIAAAATALVRSALCVVRCSGAGSIELAAPLFDQPDEIRNAATHTMHHLTLRDPGGDPVDDVLVGIFRAPRSYTGEDSVEIYGHGSPAGVRRILETLYAGGFLPAAPGEFTRRAFLNGQLDLTQAEAVQGLVNAQTSRAHKLALGRLTGSVSRAVDAIRSELVRAMAGVAAQLDYPEEDSADAALDTDLVMATRDRARRLAATFSRGRIVQDGVSIAIAGRTNAGKSSLFNALLRQDRSIVSDRAGTTRDYVEATIDIGGIPVRLYDTAGVRARELHASPVETEGIRRSHTVAAAADHLLYVVDGTEGLVDDDHARMAGSQVPLTVVWNKIDLGAVAAPSEAVEVSALTGSGLDRLNAEIVARILAEESPGDEVVIDSARQFDLLERTATALDRVLESHAAGMPADIIAVDLQDAISAIGEITGEVTTDEVLDAMFGSFCLGK